MDICRTLVCRVRRAFGYQLPEQPTVEPADKRLLTAAENGDVKSLIELLESDSSLKACNSQFSTPLHLAVKNNNVECFEILLRSPMVDLQVRDKWGRTPLHTAVIWQRLDLLKRLIEHEPEMVNVPDSDGKSILHVASATGSTEFVLYLITTKVNKNSVDHRRWTPLMCAVAIQNIDTVRVLLEGGAECNEPLRHNACMSALRIAIEKHNLEIVKLLLDYGAMVEFTVTVNLGSFSRSAGRRHNFICHNLATVAVENVDLTKIQSTEIAYRVIQASPAAPDEDACLKMYEMYLHPSRRLQRSLSRDAADRIEKITPLDVAKIFGLLSISFAVGIDLNKCNVDRLKRKFRLNETADVELFKLIDRYQKKNLRLHTALAIRRQLAKAGNCNVMSALKKAKLPTFLSEIVSLEWW